MHLTKMNQVDSGLKRSKLDYNQIYTLGCLFTCVWNACMDLFNETYLSIYYHRHMTMMIFQGHWFKSQGHGKHFSECTFTAEADQLTVHCQRPFSFC